MKAIITISGQINGNSVIARALRGGSYTRKNYGGYEFSYNTMREAVEDLRGAWRNIKAEDDTLTSLDGITRDGKRLNYDASSAVITSEDK